LKICGGAGGDARENVLQQIRFMPEQSLSEAHDLGQLFWQMPLQQSSPVEVQSLDCMHDLGHAWKVGLRHNPAALRDRSNLVTDVQHTSPMLVWQSELVEHALGH
jgi:hypothetical protein